MSYIQINIGGKLRGLKFNKAAMIILSQKVDYNNYAATSNYALIYAGLKANNFLNEVEDDFTFEQVCDWADELTVDTINAIAKCFQETQAYKD